jgi:hypothetical protein
MAKRTWTDDQLRELVAASKTWTAVLRGLGLSPRGRNHIRIACRARDLALDTSHFSQVRRTTRDVELRAAVESSNSFEAVMEKLGIEPTREARAQLIDRARTIGLVTTHYTRPPSRSSRRKVRRWSDEQLKSAVAAARSYAGVIRGLGLIAAGGNYDHVKRRIHELSVDTSHFTHQGWNVGMKFDPRPIVAIEAVLVADRWTSSHGLKKRLFLAALKTPRCELCGWAEESPDGRIPVELDHINGDKDDNRLENLRILCPNCHALQPTHRGLNQRRRRR